MMEAMKENLAIEHGIQKMSGTKLVTAVLMQGIKKYERDAMIGKDILQKLSTEAKRCQLSVNFPTDVEKKIEELVAQKKMNSVSDGIRYLLALAAYGT